MKGLNLLCLLVFVAAAVSLACSQEVSDPETAAQSGANAPTATAATNLPTAANAPTAMPLPQICRPLRRLRRRQADAYGHFDGSAHAPCCAQGCVANGRGERDVGGIGFPFSSRAVQAWVG